MLADNNPAITLSYLVQQIKMAVRELATTNLPITEVELQIQIILTDTGSGEFEFVPVTIGGNLEQSSTQNIKMTLIPGDGSAGGSSSIIGGYLSR